MEKHRDLMKSMQSKSIREHIGHSKFRFEDSTAAKEVKNDQVSVRIQTPVTACAEVNTMADLHTKAIEINSADEIRQAIKAALAKKPMTETQNVATDMTELVSGLPEEDLVSKKIPVPEEIPVLETIPVPEENPLTKEVSLTVIVRKNPDYKPESGDQIHVPQKSRKRQGNPTKAGPAKRRRSKAQIMDDFYVGKLSNLVPFKKNISASNLDSKKRPFMPRPYNGHIWKRFFANK